MPQGVQKRKKKKMLSQFLFLFNLLFVKDKHTHTHTHTHTPYRDLIKVERETTNLLKSLVKVEFSTLIG